MKHVLVLDGNQRSALAATRALGRRGVPVMVGDDCARSLSAVSRYANRRIVYPSPVEHPVQFVAALKNELAAHPVPIVFPMTDITTHLLLQHRQEFPNVVVPAASLEAFETLTDKWRLYQLALQLGIPAPVTTYISSPQELRNLHRAHPFPLVVKLCRSRLFLDDRWVGLPVQYAFSQEDLFRTIATHDTLGAHPFLLQELIEGETHGVFALYNCGRPVVFFSHRRLREKPPTGGVSVLSESIMLDPRLREITQAIFDYVNWHGVAMAEFKISNDGKPYLIEINARFWGSLQLAIDAGVDFPWLLYQVASGGSVDTVDRYTVGIKSRWLLGDLDHLYLVLKSDARAVHKCQAIRQFLAWPSAQTRHEVNRCDDLRPFFLEASRYFSVVRRRHSG